MSDWQAACAAESVRERGAGSSREGAAITAAVQWGFVQHVALEVGYIGGIGSAACIDGGWTYRWD